MERLEEKPTKAGRTDEQPDHEEQITTPRGIRLHYSEWRPDTAGERATVLLVHGYGEHLGRYGRLARRLTAHGFRVGGCDHQGMGRSGGTQMYIEDYEDYVQDVTVAQARLRQNGPAQNGPEQDGPAQNGLKAYHPSGKEAARVPAFVFGHSMGGLVALRHAQLCADQPFAGTVLSGPLLGVALAVPAWQITVGKILARIAPRFHFPLQIRPELLTRDPEEQRAAAADPLLPRFTTPAWYMATNRAMAAARQQINKVRWPTLWQIGSDDQICSPGASRDVFALLQARPSSPMAAQGDAESHVHSNSTDLQEWREYPGLRHEVHNELPADRDRAFADLLAWLNACLVLRSEK